MSLEAIGALRRAGRKPGVVFVVIGDKPAHLDDDYRMVVIKPGDLPQFMDWRPMVGLLAAIFTLQPLPGQTIAVLDALQAAGAKLFGAADASGVYPLLVNADDGHASCLRRAWELVCQ